MQQLAEGKDDHQHRDQSQVGDEYAVRGQWMPVEDHQSQDERLDRDDIRAAVAAGCRGVGVATPEAVAAAEAEGKPFDSSKLCIAMKECGVDIVLRPGFADLIEMFPSK